MSEKKSASSVIKKKIVEKINTYIKAYQDEFKSRGFPNNYIQLHEKYMRVISDIVSLNEARRIGNGDTDLKTCKNDLVKCESKRVTLDEMVDGLIDLYSEDRSNNRIVYIFQDNNRISKFKSHSTLGDGNCFWYAIAKSLNESRKMFSELDLNSVIDPLIESYESNNTSLASDIHGKILNSSFLKWISLNEVGKMSISEKEKFMVRHIGYAPEGVEMKNELNKIEKNLKTNRCWIEGFIPHFLYLAFQKNIIIYTYSPKTFSETGFKSMLILSNFTSMSYEDAKNSHTAIHVQLVNGNHYETLSMLEGEDERYITSNFTPRN